MMVIVLTQSSLITSHRCFYLFYCTISTNLTLHTNQSSLFAVPEYPSPVSPIIRDPSYNRLLTTRLGAQREQLQRTRRHYTLYVRDRRPPRSRPFAHEQQRNSSLQVTFGVQIPHVDMCGVSMTYHSNDTRENVRVLNSDRLVKCVFVQN